MSTQEESTSKESIRASFDPKVELVLLKESLKSLKAEEKRQKVKEYRERLGEHLMGIAELNAELEADIFSPLITRSSSGVKLKEINRDDLEDILEKWSGKLTISPETFSKYEAFIDAVVRTNQYVRYFQERKSGNDKDFFRNLFGLDPKGEIKMEQDAISIRITCENFSDFERLIGKSVGEEMMADAAGIGGFAGFVSSDEKLPVVVLYDEPGLSPSATYQKRVHEEKHILDAIVATVSKEKEWAHITRDFIEWHKKFNLEMERIDLSDDGFFLDFLKKIFEKTAQTMRLQSGLIAKREILAYTKNGVSCEALRGALSDGRYYKVLNRTTVEEFMNSTPEFPKSVDEEFFRSSLEAVMIGQSEAYLNDLNGALDAVQSLRDLGVSDDVIIGIFENVPLSGWKKTHERVRSAF